MSRLIETIRIEDGKLENIEYHFQRMRGSASLSWDINDILKIDLPSSGLYKLRVVYNSNGKTFDISPYTIRPIHSLKLVVDNDIVYDHKFEDRTNIERLLKLKEECNDILIVKNGKITDVSFANIIFRKNGHWYTPDSFLLNGTMRQKLLDTGKIREEKITVDNLGDFTHFKLINAMLRDDAPESEISNIR